VHRAACESWPAGWSAGVLIALAVFGGLYLGFVVVLLSIGRRGDARAVAGFVPDCLRPFNGLLRDPGVDRRRKLLLAGVVVYLASPIDLVPDFIPVAGQLDDAIVVAFALRTVLRAGGPELLDRHWPGPPASPAVITRLAYGREPPRA
jgi:uncharacterized membrane protein YkvA (DUF1232 family)